MTCEEIVSVLENYNSYFLISIVFQRLIPSANATKA